MQIEPEVLTDHTELICSTNIERIVTGRNAALAQTEALICQLEGISATTGSIGGGIARDWAMRQDFRCGCWLMEKAETAMKVITCNLDRGIWRDLMKKSGMLSLMDAQARDQWNKSLEGENIPAPTYSVPLNSCIRAKMRYLSGVLSMFLRDCLGITKLIVRAVLERRSSSTIWFLTIAGVTA